jgi:hypothetical protein
MKAKWLGAAAIFLLPAFALAGGAGAATGGLASRNSSERNLTLRSMFLGLSIVGTNSRRNPVRLAPRRFFDAQAPSKLEGPFGLKIIWRADDFSLDAALATVRSAE